LFDEHVTLIVLGQKSRILNNCT